MLIVNATQTSDFWTAAKPIYGLSIRGGRYIRNKNSGGSEEEITQRRMMYGYH